MDEHAALDPPDPPVPAPSPARSRRGIAVLLVAAVASLLILAAIGVLVARRGGDGDVSDRATPPTSAGRPPLGVVLAAVKAASRAAGTAHLRTSRRTFGDGQPFKQVVEGDVDFGSGAFDFTYVYDSPTFGDPSSFDMRRFSDGTTVWDPLREDELGLKGKKYVASRADVPDTSYGVGAGTSYALGFSIGNAPADALSYLSSVSSAVEEGVEPMDGEEVVRYGVDLDLDALQRALPSEGRPFDFSDLRPDVPHTFPGQAWLDRSGRLRKLTYRVDLAVLLTDVALKADHAVERCALPDPALLEKAAAGDRDAIAALVAADQPCPSRPPRPEELVTEGSVEVSRYGTPFTIVPPPAGEVVTEEQYVTVLQERTNATLAKPPATRRP